MAQLINEVKRMQQLAGLITESEQTNELFGFGGGKLKPETRVKDKEGQEWKIDKFVKKTDTGEVYIVRDPTGSGRKKELYTNQFTVVKESQLNELATAEDKIDRTASNLAIKKLGDMGVRIDSMKGAELMKKLDNATYSEMFQTMASYFQDHDALEKVKASMVSDGYPVGTTKESIEQAVNEALKAYRKKK